MRCVLCDCANTRVVDSRDSGADIRRRRECALCGARFTTYERAQRAPTVVKRDGRREPFSRDKLRASVAKACAKRPMAAGAVEAIADEVEGRLAAQGGAEFGSDAIGELVMGKLEGVDRVAYIRFASVYRDFGDIERFKAEIDALLGTDSGGSGDSSDGGGADANADSDRLREATRGNAAAGSRQAAD